IRPLRDRQADRRGRVSARPRPARAPRHQPAQHRGDRGRAVSRPWSGESAVNDFDDLVQSIQAVAERLESRNQQGVLECTPIVEGILRSRSRDPQHIEHTLDGLLDFCSDPEILLIYKKRCRHYDFIDPTAAAFYFHAYREMWDSELEAP